MKFSVMDREPMERDVTDLTVVSLRNDEIMSGKNSTGINYHKFVLFLLLLLLTTAFTTASAFGGTYYVDPSQGSDSNPGTASAPWKTIVHAEQNADNGSTVYLRPGKYGDVTINRTGNNGRSSWADGILFTKVPGQARPELRTLQIESQINHFIKFDEIFINCTIGSPSANALWVKGQYVTISNSEIKGTIYESSSGYYEQDRSTKTMVRLGGNSGVGDIGNFTLENCHCYYAATGVQIGGNFTGDLVLRNNHIHDVGGSLIMIAAKSNGHTTYIENNHLHTELYMWVPDHSETMHGSGLSLRTDNITARNNIIRACAGSTQITTYSDSGYVTGGYKNMRFENNLLYDARSPWYNIRFFRMGSNLVFNNNTIAGSHLSKFGTDYYRTALKFDSFENCDFRTVQLNNNIFVGSVGAGNITSFGSAKGNLFYSLYANAWRDQAWINSNLPDNKVYCWNSNESMIFKTDIFRGGSLFDQWAFKRIDNGQYGLYNGVDLGDSFQLKPGSVAVGYADPAYASADAHGSVEGFDGFISPPVTRDSDPDSGAYEYGAFGPVNQPPIANAGPDQTLNVEELTDIATVLLDGSASSDPDGSIAEYSWTEYGIELAVGEKPIVQLPVDEHNITLTVTDDKGLTATDTVLITVQAPDQAPPTILSVTASLNSVEILFDSALDPLSAQNTANYTIDNNIVITSALLDPGLEKVTLSTSSHTDGVIYTLTAAGIEDTAGNAMPEMSLTYSYDNTLAGYWKFDEGQGNIASDSSGNANSGTLINAPGWTTGKIGGALSFDNSGNYVNCGNDSSLNITGSFTACAWIKPASFGPNGFGRILDKGSGTTGFSIFLGATSQCLEYVIYGGVLAKSDPQTITINQWQYITVVYDQNANLVNFYIDGQPTGMVNYTSPPKDSAGSPLVIGIRGYDLNRTFDGLIDDVRLYSRALTESEVQQLFSNAHAFAFAPIGDKIVDENSTLAFTVQTTDPDTQVSLTEHNLPSEPSFSDNAFNWTPTYDDAGVYDATFVAQNGEIEDFETINITVNNVNRTPVLEPITDKVVDEDALLVFDVTASDPDGDTIFYAAYNLPDGSSFSNQTFTWTPDYEQAGTYILAFTASDGQLEDLENVTITVNNIATNSPPVLDPIGDKSVIENETLTFTVNAADPDGGPVIYSIEDLPAGAEFVNQTFSWTPAQGQAGSFNVTFKVTDGHAEDSETITIVVSPPPQPHSSLVGYWKFDENSGSLAYDSSGMGNTAVLTNGAYRTGGKIGNAVTLDGIDDHVNCGSDASLDISGSLTIAAWIKPHTFGRNGYGRIVDKGDSSTGFCFFVKKSRKAISYVVYGGKIANSTSNVIALNQWRHVAIVYDSSASVLTFYVNGQQAGSKNWTQSPQASAHTSMIIGARGIDLKRNFDGEIDEVHVYDHSLSAAEIQLLASSTAANTAPVLSPLSDKTVTEQQSLFFTVNAFDAEGDNVTYSVQNLPEGAVFQGNEFSWTPSEGRAGTYNVTFTASDGELEDSQTITITVNPDQPTEPTEVIIDNGEPGTSFTGTWRVSKGANPYGSDSLYGGKGGSTYTFQADIQGTYVLSMWWTCTNNRSTSVPVKIYDGNTLIDSLILNQFIDGGRWNVLGTYTFGGTAKVVIIAESGDSTCADAVKFTPVP